MIKPCKCVHEWQDSQYGKGKRVYNKAGSKENVKWRCTVCGNLYSSDAPKSTAK